MDAGAPWPPPPRSASVLDDSAVDADLAERSVRVAHEETRDDGLGMALGRAQWSSRVGSGKHTSDARVVSSGWRTRKPSSPRHPRPKPQQLVHDPVGHFSRKASVANGPIEHLSTGDDDSRSEGGSSADVSASPGAGRGRPRGHASGGSSRKVDRTVSSSAESSCRTRPRAGGFLLKSRFDRPRAPARGRVPVVSRDRESSLHQRDRLTLNTRMLRSLRVHDSAANER